MAEQISVICILTLVFESCDDEFEAVGLCPPTVCDVFQRHKVGPSIDGANRLLRVPTRKVRLQKKRHLIKICSMHGVHTRDARCHFFPILLT